MKTCFLSLSVILCLAYAIKAPAQHLTKEMANDELYIIYTSLAELHPGLTLYRTEKDLELKYNSIKDIISRINSISRSETLSLYRDLCSYIKCGHTIVYDPAEEEYAGNHVEDEAPNNQTYKEIVRNGIGKLVLPTFYTVELKRKGIRYKEYLDSFFREAKEKNCKEIIIDIRGNRGGSVHMAAYLASFFIDSCFTLFTSVELTDIKNVTYDNYIDKDAFFRFRRLITERDGNKRYYRLHRELRPRKPHSLSPGPEVKLEILTDKRTFSAASMFASVCSSKSDAIIIGDRSTVKMKGSGLSPVRLILPYSKFIVEIPIAYIFLN